MTIVRGRGGDLVLIGRRFYNDKFVLDMRRLLSAMDIHWIGSSTEGMQPVHEPSAERVECVVEMRARPGEAIFAMQDAVGEPVSVISGSSSAEMSEMFKPHPYDAFLSKPYTLQELKCAIDSLPPRNPA